MVMVKGKAQAREGQTSLLAESIQTHFDTHSIADEPSRYQPALVPLAPTINGLAFQADEPGEEGGDVFASSYISHAGDDNPPPDASPFANELPPWMDGARQPERPTPTPRTVTFVAAGEPHHAETNGENGSADREGDGASNGENGTQPAPVAVNDAPVPAYAAHEAEAAGQDPPPEHEPDRPAATEDDPPAPAPDPAATPLPGRRGGERRLVITFRRSGNLERDKYRLKEIYERVRDPRGRDRFVIRIVNNGQAADLTFPNDLCTINDVLIGELVKHFKVEVAVYDDFPD
jgi:hypothetical protein